MELMMNLNIRAWLKTARMMRTIEGIRIQGDGNYEICFNNKENGRLYEEGLGENEAVYLSSLSETDEKFELMLSTGLFDKNGQEIFAGDIIKENKSVGYVFWGSSDESIKADGFSIKWGGNPDFFSTSLGVRSNKVKIIGNIFENFDLFKKSEEKYSDIDEEHFLLTGKIRTRK